MIVLFSTPEHPGIEQERQYANTTPDEAIAKLKRDVPNATVLSLWSANILTGLL